MEHAYVRRLYGSSREDGGDVVFKNLEVGTFIPGMIGGSRVRMDENGYAEMTGLTLREFLEVPELRFNRVDVVSGELWNSIASARWRAWTRQTGW